MAEGAGAAGAAGGVFQVPQLTWASHGTYAVKARCATDKSDMCGKSTINYSPNYSPKYSPNYSPLFAHHIPITHRVHHPGTTGFL